MNNVDKIKIMSGVHFPQKNGEDSFLLLDELRISAAGDATYLYYDTDNKPRMYVGPLDTSHFEKLQGLLPAEIFDPILTPLCEKEYICDESTEVDVLAISRTADDGTVSSTILKWDLINCPSKVHKELLECSLKASCLFYEIRQFLEEKRIKPPVVTDNDLLNNIDKLV